MELFPNTQVISSSILPNPTSVPGYIPISNSMGAYCLLNKLELKEFLNHEIAKRQLMQRDHTRSYHSQIAQQELAFRHSLSNFYAASSQHEVLQQTFSKRSSQILQPNFSKNMQQTSSGSPDSVLPEQPEWSSLREVNYNLEVPEKYNSVDKYQLMSKELKEGSGSGREGNSKEQKIQTEQQQKERDIIDNLEKQENKMKKAYIPSNEHERSSNSSPSINEECVICNKVFNFRDDFESHLAGRKHAEQLEKMKDPKVLSEIKEDSKKCANAGGKELISIESVLLANDNVEKTVKNKLVWKVRDNSLSHFHASSSQHEVLQQTFSKGSIQILQPDFSKNLQQTSSRSSDSILPEQAEWSSLHEVNYETEVPEKYNLVDKYQLMSKELKEGSGNGREGNSKEQNMQIEQQQKEGDIIDNLEKQEKNMKKDFIPSNERERSLNLSPLINEECVICNKVFNFLDDFESHLAGREHAEQLGKMKDPKVLSEIKDDSKKCANAVGKKLMSIESGLSANDNVKKTVKDKLVWKVRDNSLSHFHAASSQHEVLQQTFSKRSSEILQPNFGKNLQQTSSRSPDLVLSEQPEWSSLREANYKPEVPEKYNSVDEYQLMSKELKEGSGNGREGNSKEQKMQTEQQQKERDIIDNLEKQENKMKKAYIPTNKHERSLTSSPSINEECVICNKVFNFWDDFESHLAGRKHAEQLEKMKDPKALSEIKDDSKKCENAGGKELISIESGLLANENVEKTVKKKLVWKVRDNNLSHFHASSSQHEVLQQTLSKRSGQILQPNFSKNLQQTSLRSPDLVLPEQPEWASLREVNYKTEVPEKYNLVDKYQLMSKDLKEGSGNGREGNSKEQKMQTEQQQKEGDIIENLEKQEEKMKKDCIPSNEHERSLNSSPLINEECVICNKAFNLLDDFESQLAGRQHAEQLEKMKAPKALSEIKDDSKKCANADGKELISIESGLSVNDNVEKTVKNKLVWKVTDINLSHFHAASSQHEVLQETFSKRLSQILQPNFSKNFQQTSSWSPDSGLPERPSWSALCEVGYKMELLEKHDLVDKHLLMPKEQKMQTEQQQKEGDIFDNLEKQEKNMKKDFIPSNEHEKSLNTSPLINEECVICNKVFNFWDDFEPHLAGREHAEQLGKMKDPKVLSEIKDDSKKCANAGGKEFKSIESGLPANVNVERRVKNELVWKVKDNSLSHFHASSSHHEVLQQTVCERSRQMVQPNFSKNLQQTSSSSPDSVLSERPGWSSLCEVDYETEVLEKHNLVDKHQLITKELKEGSANGREGNTKEQTMQIEQQQRERDIINNLEKLEKKMKKDCIPSYEHQLITKELKEGSGNGSEGNSKDQKTQTEQQHQERDIINNIEKQEKKMNKDSIPSNEHERSLNSSPFLIEECAIGDKVFNFQGDFESHLARRKHAEQLGKMKDFKVLSEIKDDRKKCANASGKELISIETGLPANDNVEKKAENKLVWKVKGNMDLVDKNEKVVIKENTELSRQQQVIERGMPYKICERSSNSNQLYSKDDRDLDHAKSNKFDVKVNAVQNEHWQMREENSNQKKAQMEQQMKAGNSKHQKTHVGQQKMEGGIHSKEHEGSLNSNQLMSNGCCNIVLNVQVDLEAHLAGRKHAEQLKKMENKPVCKVTDDRDLGVKSNKVGVKETAEPNDQDQMNGGGTQSDICIRSSNLRQLSINECNMSKEKDDVEKYAENKLFWKAKDDKYLGAKPKKVDKKENAELNEQCLMMEGNAKQQKLKMDQQMKEGNSKQQKPQMEQQMKEGNSKQQKPQMEQQMKGGDSKQQKPQMEQQKPQMEQQMKQRDIPSKEHERSLNSNQVKECMICNIVLNFQVDFEAHLAGRKHAKNLKKIENKHAWKGTDEKDLGAKSHKVGMKEMTELNEQQQMKASGIPFKICKRSSKSSQLSINKCNISIAKDDADKCAKTKPVWNIKHNRDFGAKSNMLSMKDNLQLNEQLQIKETNSKEQKPQTEQQLQVRNIIDNLEKREEQMEGGIPSNEHKRSSMSQSTIKGCMTYNKAFNFQVDTDSYFIGKKQAKQLKIMENKPAWKIKDDRDLDAKSKKVDIKQNAGLNEQQLMKGEGMRLMICKISSNSSHLSIKDCKTYKVKDDMEKSAKNKPVRKVEDHRDFCSKSNKAEMKENAELNEQQQMEEVCYPRYVKSH